MFQQQILGTLVISVAMSCLASCSNVDPSTNTNMTSGNGSGGGGYGGTAHSSSSGEGGVGGNQFCAGARWIDIGGAVDGNLGITGQEDFYIFKGQEGQVLSIDIDAQYLHGTGFDQTVIDSVVTLYDGDGVQIAENDDPLEYATNDSRLYTILPKTRDYCIRVSECWTNPGMTCGGEKDKLVTKYTLYLDRLMASSIAPISIDTETGDAPASATEIKYGLSSSNNYFSTVWGRFDHGNDVDVFGFTLPNDVSVPANSRSVGYFFFTPTGPNENGSTATLGNMWVAEAADPGQTIAHIDANVTSILAPRLETGKPYLLFVTRASGSPLANDFYFIRHSLSASSTLEVEQTAGQNDMLALAETIVVNPETNRAFLEGDILPAPTDIDDFRIVVPNGMAQVRASCSARYYGSGLRDLTVSLRSANGEQLAANAFDIEDASTPAFIPWVPIGNNAEVFLEVSANSQEMSVASTFYSCTVAFVP